MLESRSELNAFRLCRHLWRAEAGLQRLEGDLAPWKSNDQLFPHPLMLMYNYNGTGVLALAFPYHSDSSVS